MVNIYNINGSKVPSKEYVDQGLKDIKTELINHINETYAHGADSTHKKQYTDPVIEYDEKNVELSGESDKIQPEDIETNKDHMFITGEELDTIRRKPTREDVDEIISQFKDEINKSIDSYFTKLINNKDITYNLKNVISILADEGYSANILNKLAKCVEASDFEKHKESNSHISGEDRINLDKLNDAIKDGVADWNASPNETGYIKNKPSEMKANGGNADTLCGLQPEMIGKRIYDLIVGKEGHTKDHECDALMCDNFSNMNEVGDLIMDEQYRHVYIRNGVYTFNSGLNITDTQNRAKILEGVPDSSIIHMTNVELDRAQLYGIDFTSCNIRIGSNVQLVNCQFEDSTIILDRSALCRINNCKFSGCKFMYSGRLINNIVTENIFHGNKLAVLGNTNIISNNITV